eukprot:scaffold60234_cov60-Attheya_sp.AAC.1
MNADAFYNSFLDECSDGDDDNEAAVGYLGSLTGVAGSLMGVTEPSFIKQSATSTQIIVPFIRQETLAKLDHRRKKVPDHSQSILDEIGNASISLFNRCTRRSFNTVSGNMKRPVLLGADGTPSPLKRMPTATLYSPPVYHTICFTVLYDDAMWKIAPCTLLLLLVPDDDQEYEYFEAMAKDLPVRDKVHINGRLFLQIDAFVYSNPKRDTILPLMPPHYSSSLIRDLYLQDKGITISPSNDCPNSFQIIWKQFHSQLGGIQIWASMKHPRPVDTFLRRYKSEKTINNVFNYLHLHVELRSPYQEGTDGRTMAIPYCTM